MVKWINLSSYLFSICHFFLIFFFPTSFGTDWIFMILFIPVIGLLFKLFYVVVAMLSVCNIYHLLIVYFQIILYYCIYCTYYCILYYYTERDYNVTLLLPTYLINVHCASNIIHTFCICYRTARHSYYFCFEWSSFKELLKIRQTHLYFYLHNHHC